MDLSDESRCITSLLFQFPPSVCTGALSLAQLPIPQPHPPPPAWALSPVLDSPLCRHSDTQPTLSFSVGEFGFPCPVGTNISLLCIGWAVSSLGRKEKDKKGRERGWDELEEVKEHILNRGYLLKRKRFFLITFCDSLCTGCNNFSSNCFLFFSQLGFKEKISGICIY